LRMLRLVVLVIALIGWLIKKATTNSNAPSKQPTALNQNADPPPQQPMPRESPLPQPPTNLSPQEQLPENARPLHDAGVENLKTLFAALQKFAAADPQGHFPDRLDDLVAGGFIAAEAIRSPFD